jgi:copper chaperone NosL
MNKILGVAYSVLRLAYGVALYGIRYTQYVTFSIILLGLIACNGNSNTAPIPPALHYGEDVCEFCGMIISEERFAAAYVTSDGHGHTFDDIGDMVKAHLKMQEDVTAFFVHDHERRAWIRAETAYFVLSQELPTPMLSGLAAFDSMAKANALAAEKSGDVLTFDQLLAHYHSQITRITP